MTTSDARKRLAERQATPADTGSTPDDRDALAEVLDSVPEPILWHDGYHIASLNMADAVLTSEWLAEHDRQVAGRAWDEGNAAYCEPAYVHLNPYRADRIEGDS